MSNFSKVFYCAQSDIQDNITNGTIDAWDIIITSDADHQLFIVSEQGEAIPITDKYIANSYLGLLNKPSLNNVEITSNKTFEDYGLQRLTNLELESLLR